MAATALLFSGPRGDVDAVLSLVIDATVSEQHSREQELTEYEVEEGAAITDHARLKPDRLSMECCVSNTPLNGGELSPGRAEDIYEQIRLCQENATLLTCLTSLRRYEDMVIENLSVPRMAKEAGAVRFTVTLKQIRLVQNKTTTVTVTKEPIAKKKVGTGKQSGQEAQDGAQQEKSWAAQLSDSSGLSDWLKQKGAF